MGTTVLTDSIENCLDFEQLTKGDQFFRSELNNVYDMHESIILSTILDDCVFQFKSTKLKYTAGDNIRIDTEYSIYTKINDSIFKTYTWDFEGIKYGSMAIKESVRTRIKQGKLLGSNFSNNVNFLFCAIPIKKSYLIIELALFNNNKFISNELHFATYNKATDTLTPFIVDKPIQFIEFIESASNIPEFIIFKEQVINASGYSINDFLNNKDNKLFKKLFPNKNMDSYFKPVFEHEKFQIYIDYHEKNKQVICKYDNSSVIFVSTEYRRIIDAIKGFYFKDGMVNPFTGELNKKLTSLYKDAGGLIFEFSNIGNGEQCAWILIYGIYVPATDSEKLEIFDRMNVVDTLTNS